jgi:uncharacterized membrane protein
MYSDTVELCCRELKGTVNMCSNHQKFEPPRSRNFRANGFRGEEFLEIDQPETRIAYGGQNE